jgi:hypothetical protein
MVQSSLDIKWSIYGHHSTSQLLLQCLSVLTIDFKKGFVTFEAQVFQRQNHLKTGHKFKYGKNVTFCTSYKYGISQTKNTTKKSELIFVPILK